MVDAADQHGVAPLVHRAFERFLLETVPALAASRLRDAYCDAARRGLVLSAALLTVLDALADAGVVALPLKGPVLAALLYPDPALRPFSDIDILVRRTEVPTALRALARIGYALDARLRRLPVPTLLAVSSEVIVHGPGGVQLDLHWEIAQRGYPFRFDPELLFHSIRPVEFDDRTVPGLTPEALLVFLCVHGAKHGWSRLIWLADIARLAGAGFDEPMALDFAARAGCTRPVLLGLLLALDLLDAPVSESILERARKESDVAALARTAALRLARCPSDAPHWHDMSFNAFLAERAWDRAKHYAALLAPSEAELQRLRLPPSLRTLYYPFRLARLAAKYTMKLAGR